MKETITRCDICGEKIPVGIDKGNFRLFGRATKETIDTTTLDYKDLCPVCTLKLFFLINKLLVGMKKR